MEPREIRRGLFYADESGVIRQVVSLDVETDSIYWRLTRAGGPENGYCSKLSGKCSVAEFAAWAQKEVPLHPSAGFVCQTCGTRLAYNEQYDADYCYACDVWVSAKCGAESPCDCHFDCQNRPDKPSQVI
jgi:hypothetical protein